MLASQWTISSSLLLQNRMQKNEKLMCHMSGMDFICFGLTTTLREKGTVPILQMRLRLREHCISRRPGTGTHLPTQSS